MSMRVHIDSCTPLLPDRDLLTVSCSECALIFEDVGLLEQAETRGERKSIPLVRPYSVAGYFLGTAALAHLTHSFFLVKIGTIERMAKNHAVK
ncbi:hypothetical protein CF651_17260 [Paenibacillus rigui]|uniref:Uncharacterized protein n=1 Tax=Paenibacillus rigui TaxID=554312 RepID=A0A229UPN1_9BACL|nr:hypothetical protein CF651_17260 [Paenibacillus rigui]